MLGTLPHPPSCAREGGTWTETNGTQQASKTDLPSWNWPKVLGNFVKAQTEVS